MINIGGLNPQFITDECGHRTSVVLNITDFQELIRDLEDLAIMAERRDEPTTSHSDFVNELKDSGIL